MAEFRMNELTETTTISDTDILHTRTSGGIDKKITGVNLRTSMSETIVSIADDAAINLSNYTTNVTVIANLPSTKTLAVTGFLANGKMLKIVNSSTPTLVITINTSVLNVFKNESLEYISNGSAMSLYERTVPSEGRLAFPADTAINLSDYYTDLICYTASVVTLTFSGNLPEGRKLTVVGTNTTAAVASVNGISYNITSGQSHEFLSISGAMVRMSDSLPIGFIYMQVLGENTPAALNFMGTWQNVSASHAGNSFRTEGGNAAAFGGTQTDAMQRITAQVLVFNAVNTGGGLSQSAGAFTISQSTGTLGLGGTGGGIETKYGQLDFDSSLSTFPNTAKTNDVETRVQNETVRLWKRTV